jgi:hypothetical protein
MTRVGLLLACMLVLVACFDERKVSLGSLPVAGAGAAGGGGASGAAAHKSEEEEGEPENDDFDDLESGSTPGEDDNSP